MTTPQSKPAPVCLCGLLGWPPHVAAIVVAAVLLATGTTAPLAEAEAPRRERGRPGDHFPGAGTMVAEAPRPRDPRNDGSAC